MSLTSPRAKTPKRVVETESSVYALFDEPLLYEKHSDDSIYLFKGDKNSAPYSESQVSSRKRARTLFVSLGVLIFTVALYILIMLSDGILSFIHEATSLSILLYAFIPLVISCLNLVCLAAPLSAVWTDFSSTRDKTTNLARSIAQKDYKTLQQHRTNSYNIKKRFPNRDSTGYEELLYSLSDSDLTAYMDASFEQYDTEMHLLKGKQWSRYILPENPLHEDLEKEFARLESRIEELDETMSTILQMRVAEKTQEEALDYISTTVEGPHT